MQLLIQIGVILLGYLLGSVPSGLIIVKLKTGKDVRQIESGRTGGTNAMRAAGFWAGLLTAISDLLKGTLAVWLAQWILPDSHWVHALAPIAAILGHNYSIFLPEYDDNGRFVRLRGGAGGATALGGSIGLWAPSVLIILPLAVLMYFTIGYASVTTLSVAIFACVAFIIRFAVHDPGAHIGDIIFGVAATLILAWALRPNLKKLVEGNERIIGISLHGWLKAKKEKSSE